MSFGAPKPPKVAKPPNPAMPAMQASWDDQGRQNIPGSINPLSGSLISTSSQGLTRKAQTRKPSLISGGTNASQ